MKKYKETVIKGIVALLFSQILIKIIGLAYKLYLTNKQGFGDSGNAIYSSGFQIYALLLTFSSTGVPNAISKLVSQRLAVGDSRGAHRIFKIAFFTFATFGILGTILLFLGANVISNKWLEIPEAEYSLITLSPSIFFVSITSVIRGYFNGRQNLSVTAKSQTIEQVFKTLLTIAIVEIIAKLSENNTMIMAGAANLATTLATFFSFTYIYIYYKAKRNEIAQEIHESINYEATRIRKTLRKILKESVPISLTSLMSSFNKNIDLFTVVKILKTYMSEEQAKIQYGILSGKIDVLCILPLSLNIPFVTAMVPSISKLVITNNKEKLAEKIKIYIRITILIALPTTLIFTIFARPILKLLFPNASSGTFLLQVNSVSIIFAMLAQTINGALQGIGKNNIPLFAFSCGMMLKFFTNIMLIKNPNIGIIGAAVGNIICNAFVFLVGFCVLMKNIELKMDLKKAILVPFIFTGIIIVISTSIYFGLKSIVWENIATISSILVAIVFYGIFIIKFNPFKKAKN